MKDLIKFAGDQGTSQPEYEIAKLAINFRLQKQLIIPTWILAIATIITLLGSIIVTTMQINSIQSELHALETKVDRLNP